ncbi:hypothetical protein GCM10028805_44830 [Spirosoma harenae]
MVSVNEYLKKLLYQYDCIVIPELGAFLTHYQPASYTEANGLYLPPRKRVAFNEALRFDDGILGIYIMLHESISRDAAQKRISSFVQELRQEVEKAGRYDLDGIGTFTYNEEGKLQFNPSLRHNFLGDAYGMSALSVEIPEQEPKPEPVLEAIPLPKLEPVLPDEEIVTLTPYRPNRVYWRVAAVTLLVGSLGTISYFSVIKPGQPFRSSLDPANLLRFPTSFFERVADKTDKKVTSESVAMPKVVAEPVAKTETQPVEVTPAKPITETKPVEIAPAKPNDGWNTAETVASKPVAVKPVTEMKSVTKPAVHPVAVAAAPVVKPAPVKPTAAPVTAPVVAAPKVAPTVAKAKVVPTPAPTLPVATAPIAVAKPKRVGPYFTVIAGVFSSKENALRVRNRLRKVGYADAFIIFPAPGEKNLFKVAAAGSAIRTEAVANMARIDSLAGTQSWILKN